MAKCGARMLCPGILEYIELGEIDVFAHNSGVTWVVPISGGGMQVRWRRTEDRGVENKLSKRVIEHKGSAGKNNG